MSQQPCEHPEKDGAAFCGHRAESCTACGLIWVDGALLGIRLEPRRTWTERARTLRQLAQGAARGD